MSFENPYAFLALIAIPILIIIYILRNKYKEETAPSTYLWELSQKFMKKRNPLHKVEHLLSLIVQILTVTGMAFALAHPTFTLKEKSDNIVFILDSSASMNMEHEGKTRFALAKEEIAKKAEEAYNGSNFTLVLAGEENRVVCQEINDVSRFKMYLDTVEPTLYHTNFDSALTLAQEMFSKDQANTCYLATDKKLEKHENLELIDVSDNEKNFVISELTCSYTKPRIHINVKGYAYNTTEEVKVRFYINDNPSFGYYPIKDVVDGAEFSIDQDFELKEDQIVDSVDSLKAVIENKDNLSLDNTLVYYANNGAVNTRALIVSDKPFYLKTIFNALKVNTVKVVSSSSYRPSNAYDITVFDSFTPSALPTAGSVWFFNAQATLENAGFRFQNTVEITNGGTLEYTNNESLLYKELTKDTKNNEILVSKYSRYSLDSNFTTLLTYNNIPMVFAGKNAKHQRQVVFSFDLHDSNLPLKYDFAALMRNLVNYSKPKLMDKFAFNVGDSLTMSISDDVTRVEVLTPSLKSEPLELTGAEVLKYKVKEVGTYELVVYTETTTQSMKAYSQYIKEESIPLETLTNDYSLVKGANTKKGDGIFDNILPFVIVVAVLFALDWILYAHEQF